MAKQGSIRHYRQEGDVKAPASLPYGELAIAKDGTVYAGNEVNAPVELATAANVKSANTAASTAQTTANNAATAASNAQTTANAAMPIAGGTFSGNITAAATYTGSWHVRNSFVRTASGAGTGQACYGIYFDRK